jgi:hypothetical protein
MRRLAWRAAILACAATFWIASGVQASPVTYNFTSGSVDIFATITGVGGNVLDEQDIPLNGQYIEFDDMTPELLDIVLTLAGPVNLSLTQAFNGFDTVTIHSASLQPCAPCTADNLAIVNFDGSMVTVLNVNVANFAYTAKHLQVAANISASNSAGPPPAPLVNAPFMTWNPTAAGTITLNATTNQLIMSGITIATIQDATNANRFLSIKGDFTFEGNPAAPEPGSAVLLGVGLLGLLAAGRRISR